MTKFAELQQAYGDHRDEVWNYYITCRRYMNSFVKEFKAYLGAPETYQESENLQSPPKQRKYVAVAEASFDNSGELHYEEMPATQTMPDLPRDRDGRWMCGVKLVLDKAPNSYPKSAYFFPIDFSIADAECTMRIGGERGREFTFNTIDPDGPHGAFDYMINWLHEAYSNKPWDIQRQEPMGFIVHDKK